MRDEPMDTPLISIVVVSKNPGPRLATALESVWTQSTVAEVIVIDGGSTDGTAEWLHARAAQISTLVIEPDNGVYEAMNKGIAATHGEWVLFLGADDRLAEPTTLSEVISWLKATESSIVSGEVRYDDGRVYQLRQRVNPLARNFVHHQGTFYRRSLFGDANRFDSSLRIMGDYDFNLRLWKQGARFKPMPLRVAECRSAGLSDAGGWLGYREEIMVRRRYASPTHCWIWDLLSIIRFVRKSTVIALCRRHG